MNPTTTIPDQKNKRLPHERDEDTAASTAQHDPEQKDVIQQAHDDIEAGQIDTDCRVPHVQGSPCAQPAKKP